MRLRDENEISPVEVETVDMDRLKRLSSDLPSLLEYAHSVGGFSITPTEQGKIKSTALSTMKKQTQMQMDMLYEQIKLMASQVQQIQKRVEISEMIYEAKISFDPIVGGQYYLYSLEEEKILSMISPTEWGPKSCPYDFISNVELLPDRTWKVIS